MSEALELSGFSLQLVKPKFLPFAIKGTRLPRLLFLLRLYLRMPFLWRVLGQQMLIHTHTHTRTLTELSVRRQPKRASPCPRTEPSSQPYLHVTTA